MSRIKPMFNFLWRVFCCGRPPWTRIGEQRVPSNTKILTFLVIASHPYVEQTIWHVRSVKFLSDEGVPALKRMIAWIYVHCPPLEDIIIPRIQKLLNYLYRCTHRMDLDIWTEKLYTFMQEFLESTDEAWRSALIDEFPPLAVEYSHCRLERTFLYRCMGAIFAFSENKDAVIKILLKMCSTMPLHNVKEDVANFMDAFAKYYQADPDKRQRVLQYCTQAFEYMEQEPQRYAKLACLNPGTLTERMSVMKQILQFCSQWNPENDVKHSNDFLDLLYIATSPLAATTGGMHILNADGNTLALEAVLQWLRNSDSVLDSPAAKLFPDLLHWLKVLAPYYPDRLWQTNILSFIKGHVQLMFDELRDPMLLEFEKKIARPELRHCEKHNLFTHHGIMLGLLEEEEEQRNAQLDIICDSIKSIEDALNVVAGYNKVAEFLVIDDTDLASGRPEDAKASAWESLPLAATRRALMQSSGRPKDAGDSVRESIPLTQQTKSSAEMKPTKIMTGLDQAASLQTSAQQRNRLYHSNQDPDKHLVQSRRKEPEPTCSTLIQASGRPEDAKKQEPTHGTLTQATRRREGVGSGVRGSVPEQEPTHGTLTQASRRREGVGSGVRGSVPEQEPTHGTRTQASRRQEGVGSSVRGSVPKQEPTHGTLTQATRRREGVGSGVRGYVPEQEPTHGTLTQASRRQEGVGSSVRGSVPLRQETKSRAGMKSTNIMTEFDEAASLQTSAQQRNRLYHSTQDPAKHLVQSCRKEHKLSAVSAGMIEPKSPAAVAPQKVVRSVVGFDQAASLQTSSQQFSHAYPSNKDPAKHVVRSHRQVRKTQYAEAGDQWTTDAVAGMQDGRRRYR
ncbi:uncharacterized protein [Ambystoma mexicanum]|uniref:uncharacterized protein n=1 Tax=Ambystoma mexicanum TaxID=8296 RepID=UPI0037E8EB64